MKGLFGFLIALVLGGFALIAPVHVSPPHAAPVGMQHAGACAALDGLQPGARSITAYNSRKAVLPKLCTRMGSSTLPVRTRSQTARNEGMAVSAIVIASSENAPPE